MKENPTKLEFYMQEIIFQSRGRNKDFLRQIKPERIYCLQEMLKEVLQGEEKWYRSENLTYIKKSIREGIN